ENAFEPSADAARRDGIIDQIERLRLANSDLREARHRGVPVTPVRQWTCRQPIECLLRLAYSVITD
ncbi:MAG TPA: hypothetical protein VFQ80_00150, partial [Thermomicrobiales bacterium]|nr:hypothetical protein [Thermomicrobiales bacterium]